MNKVENVLVLPFLLDAGVISRFVILEGRSKFQKEGQIVRFCDIKEGQLERKFILKCKSCPYKTHESSFGNMIFYPSEFLWPDRFQYQKNF